MRTAGDAGRAARSAPESRRGFTLSQTSSYDVSDTWGLRPRMNDELSS